MRKKWAVTLMILLLNMPWVAARQAAASLELGSLDGVQSFRLHLEPGGAGCTNAQITDPVLWPTSKYFGQGNVSAPDASCKAIVEVPFGSYAGLGARPGDPVLRSYVVGGTGSGSGGSAKYKTGCAGGSSYGYIDGKITITIGAPLGGITRITFTSVAISWGAELAGGLGKGITVNGFDDPDAQIVFAGTSSASSCLGPVTVTVLVAGLHNPA